MIQNLEDAVAQMRVVSEAIEQKHVATTEPASAIDDISDKVEAAVPQVRTMCEATNINHPPSSEKVEVTFDKLEDVVPDVPTAVAAIDAKQVPSERAGAIDDIYDNVVYAVIISLQFPKRRMYSHHLSPQSTM